MSGARLRWASVAVLVASAVTLAAAWSRIPARWPVHWGPTGRPDRWATRSIASVFGPLLVGAAVCAMVWLVAWMVRRAAADQAPPRPALAGVLAEVLARVQLGFAVAFAGLALALPLLRPRSPAPIAITVLTVMTFAIVTALGHAVRRTGELRERGQLVGLDGWNGVIYRDPNDRRLLVPNPLGMGVTVNFAHPQAWLVIALLLLPILVVVLLVLVAGRQA